MTSNKLNQAKIPNYSVTSQSRHYSTNKHWSQGLISPLSLVNKKGKLKLEHPTPIFTMDLETMNINNIQSPIAISSCGVNKGKIESKLFLNDHILLKTNAELAVKGLWNQYFNYLEKLDIAQHFDKLTIFAHNLGDFDGYFLYKGLMSYFYYLKCFRGID